MIESEVDGSRPVSLSDQLLDYYRRVADEHATDPATGACRVCGDHCAPGRFAAERIMCAEKPGP